MKYSSILLKLSGESLAGKAGRGLDSAVLENYAQEIELLVRAGVRIAVVTGGGNIFGGYREQGKGWTVCRETKWVCWRLLLTA